MADAVESPDMVRVIDNPVDNRSEAFVGDTLVGFLQYRRTPKVVILTHTEVDPELERHGYGTALARHALDDARAGSERVIPRCPFVSAFVEDHPEYADVVARGSRSN